MTLGQALDSGLLHSAIGIKVNGKWVDHVEYSSKPGAFHLTFEDKTQMRNVNDTIVIDNATIAG